jgi:hypothetical protein
MPTLKEKILLTILILAISLQLANTYVIGKQRPSYLTQY